MFSRATDPSPSRTEVPSATLLTEPPPKGRWLSLSVVLLGAFMTVLDSFIGNVSLPTIESSIKASPAELERVPQ